MFQNKKLKNPILIVRPVDAINKEYTDIIMKLGSFEVELANILNAEEKQNNRKEEINSLKTEIMDRVSELSVEMDEAQKELRKKAAEIKEEPQEVKV